MRKNNKTFIPLETVIDVRDEKRLWYYIPGFNGYELSNDGYLRSMKHFKKYPYGILIRSKDNSPDPVYELSNDNNERIKIRFSHITELVINNQQVVSGYPRKTYITDTSSRNQQYFIKRNRVNGKQVHNTHFNIIEDKDIVCPIYFE